MRRVGMNINYDEVVSKKWYLKGVINQVPVSMEERAGVVEKVVRGASIKSIVLGTSLNEKGECIMECYFEIKVKIDKNEVMEVMKNGFDRKEEGLEVGMKKNTNVKLRPAYKYVFENIVKVHYKKEDRVVSVRKGSKKGKAKEIVYNDVKSNMHNKWYATGLMDKGVNALEVRQMMFVKSGYQIKSVVRGHKNNQVGGGKVLVECYFETKPKMTKSQVAYLVKNTLYDDTPSKVGVNYITKTSLRKAYKANMDVVVKGIGDGKTRFDVNVEVVKYAKKIENPSKGWGVEYYHVDTLITTYQNQIKRRVDSEEKEDIAMYEESLNVLKDLLYMKAKLDIEDKGAMLKNLLASEVKRRAKREESKEIDLGKKPMNREKRLVYTKEHEQEVRQLSDDERLELMACVSPSNTFGYPEAVRIRLLRAMHKKDREEPFYVRNLKNFSKMKAEKKRQAERRKAEEMHVEERWKAEMKKRDEGQPVKEKKRVEGNGKKKKRDEKNKDLKGNKRVDESREVTGIEKSVSIEQVGKRYTEDELKQKYSGYTVHELRQTKKILIDMSEEDIMIISQEYWNIHNYLVNQYRMCNDEKSINRVVNDSERVRSEVPSKDLLCDNVSHITDNEITLTKAWMKNDNLQNKDSRWSTYFSALCAVDRARLLDESSERNISKKLKKKKVVKKREHTVTMGATVTG